MAVNSINTSSTLMRLTGLGGSGLDSDSIVKQLMTAEKIPLTKLIQKRQMAEWKQDAYRDITNKLRELKDTYFNIAKPASNMLSQSSFKKYTGTTNNAYVNISGNADSIAGSHTVSVISVAEAGKAVSSNGVTDVMEGKAISDFSLSGKKFQITLDGVTREIVMNNYNSTGDEIVTKADTGLQALIDKAFGAGKVSVSLNSGKLKFETMGGANKMTLSSTATNDGLTALGFTSGASNRLDIYKSLDTLKGSFANDLTFNANGKLEFTINNKKFSFDKSVSLVSMMNTINTDADAKVTMKYDETSDKFAITAKQTGYGDNIIIDPATQGGNFFGTGGASGILTGSATTSQGSDAKATIDGVLVTRSSNTITLNNATYTLVKAHTDPVTQSETVSLSLNSDEVFNSIKGFVDKYNEIISNINTKLTEKYDRDFVPLTDEQKESMSEDDIKSWEAKAKAGILKGDPMLQDIVYSMRRALSDSVAGVTTNLSSIGITTGEYYEKGKLIINETKLKEAISNNPDSVADLFTKQADISYSSNNSAEVRSKRYSNEGLANRISDILEDNVRTIMGKGKLLEKAGLKGDATEYDSILYEQINDYDDDIDSLVDKLKTKESAYYAKFTALEKYMSQMNAQSSWLSSQLGGSSS